MDTWGLGLGMGSSRCSSFAVDLLASTGIIGALVFFMISLRVILPLRRNDKFVFVFIYNFLLLSCMMMSIPDISFCGLWLGLHMSILCYKIDTEVSNNEKSAFV